MSINLNDALKQTFKKPGRRIKISKNLKPFVSRVVRDGRVQKAFAEKIGHPVGQCVANNVKVGMSGREIHGIAKLCAKPYDNSSLGLSTKKTNKGQQESATEYFEVV